MAAIRISRLCRAVAAACALSGIAHAADAPAPAPEITIAIDAGKLIGPISPYVYGINGNDFAKRPHITFTRQGGNRMTAWNWENNASNAGNDWQYQSDDLLGGGDTPGAAVRNFLAPALERGKTAIITVPMAGYVAADKKGGGDVRKSGPDYLQTRFDQSIPKKNGPFAYPPDLTDHVVYQDEMVWWVNREFPVAARHGAQIFYDLDNEPDLWSSTHAEVHPKPVTYAELVEKTQNLAAAIKDVDKSAVIFGFVSYGYAGYMHLQDAPDANGRDFIDFFLDACKAMEEKDGRRLVDVLDLHWYPEARGGGHRVTDRNNAPATVQARVQAPRSLWDPTYTEDSWITNNVLHEPIDLLPRIKQKIAAHYPGTKLALTEYDFGGGDHISGTVAEADVLGIFGEQGVFAASLWGGGPFIYAGFDCYTNFDGNGGHVGDEAVTAQTSNIADVAAHASRYSTDPSKMAVVLINRSAAPQACTVKVNGFDAAGMQLYRAEGATPGVKPAGQARVTAGSATLTLPPLSVTTAVLTR